MIFVSVSAGPIFPGGVVEIRRILKAWPTVLAAYIHPEHPCWNDIME